MNFGNKKKLKKLLCNEIIEFKLLKWTKSKQAIRICHAAVTGPA